ncbi:MAG: hypothetical protein Q9224_006904, partial [Gallowayella concinna]
MLQHAQKSGAKVFEGVKVKEIHFESLDQICDDSAEGSPNPSYAQPVSALWSNELD